MLQDRRADLDSEKQKALLTRLLSVLSHNHPDLYYRTTAEIAHQIHRSIRTGEKLNATERTRLMQLTASDIKVLRSLH